jgi:hypothetical protein
MSKMPTRIREDHKCPSCGDTVVVTMTVREGTAEPSAVWLESKPSSPRCSALSASSPTAGQAEPEHGSSERSPTACSCQTWVGWRETLSDFLSCHWVMAGRFCYCPFCGGEISAEPEPMCNRDADKS